MEILIGSGFIFIVMIVFAAGMLFREFQHMRETVQGLKAENEALRAKVEALETANRKHLPVDKLEDLEHAKAAWIALVSDLEVKQTLVDNLGAWLDRAREDRRKQA